MAREAEQQSGDTAAVPTVWYLYTDNYSSGGLTGLRVETRRREKER